MGWRPRAVRHRRGSADPTLSKATPGGSRDGQRFQAGVEGNKLAPVPGPPACQASLCAGYCACTRVVAKRRRVVVRSNSLCQRQRGTARPAHARALSPRGPHYRRQPRGSHDLCERRAAQKPVRANGENGRLGAETGSHAPSATVDGEAVDCALGPGPDSEDDGCWTTRSPLSLAMNHTSPTLPARAPVPSGLPSVSSSSSQRAAIAGGIALQGHDVAGCVWVFQVSTPLPHPLALCKCG
jgi:hypothetical protein